MVMIYEMHGPMVIETDVCSGSLAGCFISTNVAVFLAVTMSGQCQQRKPSQSFGWLMTG